MDINGHGTHVSGIIAAEQNNAKGVTGVAPETKIVPLKILGMPINGVSIYNQDIFNLIHAVEYINNNNIEIANMSIDFWDNSDVAITELENAMKNASNTLFVVAAGNNGVDLSIDSNHYPACADIDNIIVVANLMSDGTLSSTSNYGGNTSIAAPGTGIYSTCPTNNYCLMDGTSMAAPHVSGVAALIWSYYKNLTAAQVKQRIISPNNVSYSNKLDGKVSSNGCLNAWYAFSNDSASPRKIPRRESLLNEIQKRKERIAEIKSKKPDNEKTTGIFVKSLNDNCIDILNECLSSYKYEIVKQYDVTGIYLLEFDSIEHADEAINLLNARSDIKFAEPNYVLTLGWDY